VGDLPAGSEHQLDWFHVAMRLTVLSQYAKGLAHHNPLEATALQHRLERIKWRLWHGDADEALTRAEQLAADVAALDSGYPGLARLIKAAAGLVTYIGNNAGAITDYAARWDHGEIISTAFAESTVDLVISRRFAKKQQMQWSKKGAHRLLQTRTRTLDGTLHDLFTTLVSGHARQRWSGSTPRCRSLSNLPRFLVLSAMKAGLLMRARRA
jgi:hypothetical protein